MTFHGARFRLAPTVAVALTVLSLTVSQCRKAPPIVPHTTTSASARSSAPLRSSGHSQPESSSEPLLNAAPHSTAAAFPQSSAAPQPGGHSGEESLTEPTNGAPPTTASPPSISVAIPAAPLRSAAIPEPPIHLGIDAAEQQRANATRVLEHMKPAFVSCRKRGLAQKPAGSATLRGSFRMAIGVARSGKVSGFRFPNFNPRNPDFDAANANGPYPNPTNANLSLVIIPCVEALVDQARFPPAESEWWILLDVHVD